jgi:hypothetical protein
MDLFVELLGVPEGLIEHLEVLYQQLETSSQIAAPGTLTIVRGARVPIIKYIDSHGSSLPPFHFLFHCISFYLQKRYPSRRLNEQHLSHRIHLLRNPPSDSPTPPTTSNNGPKTMALPT